jgi:steroid delta-isomerase-like uncharacterized protein
MTADELSDGWLAAWASPETASFEAVCARDLHYEDPLTPEPLRGLEALGEHVEMLRRGLPDARLEATGPRAAQGRYLAVPCRLLGTHRGELGDLPATGRFVRVHGVFYCELDHPLDGRRAVVRLARVRAFFDLYDAGVQLGALPRGGTLGARALLMLRGFGMRLRRP